MLSESFISELKARNDIEEVISSYVNVKRRGRNLEDCVPSIRKKRRPLRYTPTVRAFTALAAVPAVTWSPL